MKNSPQKPVRLDAFGQGQTPLVAASAPKPERAPSHVFGLRLKAAVSAVAVAIGTLGAASDANALALGKVNVLSALGEPLRAEIDVPEMSAEEAGSLRTNIASPDAFRAAGVEFNSALTNAQVRLLRRANGQPYLSVTSNNAVTEPFVDLILEATWGSGRIVRDYTMLFDPPSMRQLPPPVAQATSPSAPSAPVYTAAPPAPVRNTSSASTGVPRASAASPAGDKQVRVRAGDTAGAIAARHKPQGMSLDQMLVSMLSQNPDAFIGGNVNRIKAGAVLSVPEGSTGAPDASAATGTVRAQSKDFNNFRQRMAQNAPKAQVGAADRSAAGKVQTTVKDAKPQAGAPDKLTLSKGAVAAASADKVAKQRQSQDSAARTAELNKNIQDLKAISGAAGASGASGAKPGIGVGSMAAASAAKPAASAVAGAASAIKPAASAAVASAASAAKPVTSAVAAAASAITAAPASAALAAASVVKPAASAAVAAASAAVAAASAAKPAASVAAAVASAVVAAKPASAVAAVASAATAGASAVVPTPAVADATPPKPKAVPAPPPPPPEPSFIESITSNPLTLPVGGGLLAAGLGLFGFMRWRKNKSAPQVDSSFLESRLRPDSFFGVSGGQQINTSDKGAAAGAANNTSSSSMVYSASQLDAAGDVDPVAEADVYLAYGRDLQAEEILKEALRTTPKRTAIHAKLLEIYAKRRDTRAFENIAKDMHGLCNGMGQEWDRVCELGRDMDAGNALYQGGAPSTVPSNNAAAAAAVAAGAAIGAGAIAATMPISAMPQPKDTGDVDLDLDFSLGDDLVVDGGSLATPGSKAAMNEAPMMGLGAPDLPPMDMNFGMDSAHDLNDVKLSVPDMAASSNGLSFSAAPVNAPALSKPMEFDLGALSLDLPGQDDEDTARDPIPVAVTGPAPLMDDSQMTGDPLETKLQLAMEFHEIGDKDGARALIREVVAEADGAMKAKAQRMLADLG